MRLRIFCMYCAFILWILPGISWGMEISRLILFDDQALVSLERVMDGRLLLEAPPELVPDSVVVSPKAGGSLRSISIEPLRALSGRVSELQEALRKKQSVLAVMKKDQAMLEKQIDIIYDAAGSKGKATAFEKARLSDALGFIETRVSVLNSRIVELTKKSDKLETEIRDLQSQLGTVSQKPGYQIALTGNGSFVISYVVTGAAWSPEYLVHAQPGSSRVTIETSVKARQSTGTDWDIKEMHVSTGRPGFGIEAPELHPWYVYKAARREARFKAESNDMAAMAASAPMAEAEPAVQATATSYLMGAARNIHLPGDGTPVAVNLSKQSQSAGFSLVTMPRFTASAFLRAETTLGDGAPLIPGTYSSFVDGVFSGRGTMKRVEPGQKMFLDLGVDEGIRVTRKETQALRDKTLTGKDRIIYSYEITMENTRNQKASITVKDQIPLSRDTSVEVDLLNTSPTARPDRDGILSWTLDLEPHQKKTAAFTFSIVGETLLVPEPR